MSKFSINIAVGLFLILLETVLWPNSVEAGGDKGEDIILAKGKLIVRGGKDKGNIILDQGGHHGESGGHEVHHMLPMINHFNPYSFYPMQHQQHHHAPLMIKPIYIEDHSHMMQHHEPEMHHHQEYHHEEPHHQQHHHHEEEPHHQEHHGEMDHHHYQHHEPMHHHEEPHYEHMHQEHHEEPHHGHMMHHHEEEHHEPMGHQYEHHHDGHHEEEGDHHGGHYEGHTHPMMAMMMHGSGLQPAYQQQPMLAQQAMSNLYQQAMLANYQEARAQEAQAQAQAQAAQAAQEDQSKSQNQDKDQDQAGTQKINQSASGATKSKFSLLDKSANNPLVAMIKPLFKRNHSKENSQKKPSN